jgi:ankyrin repeat protein
MPQQNQTEDNREALLISLKKKFFIISFLFICSFVSVTNLYCAPLPQNQEGQHVLELILNDDADAVEQYFSTKPVPKLSNASLFKTAIYRGNKRIVEAFIRAGADMGEHGLICAALPDSSLTKLLIEHGANTLGNICEGLSPLKMASKRGYQGTVQILLVGVSGVSETGKVESPSSAALVDAAMAGNVPIMKMLLEKGGMLSAKELREVTQRNCMGGNLAALKLLKEKGIDPDYDRCYLYLSWIEKPYPELLDWLQSQSKLTKFEIDGQPLINAAAERGNMLMAKFLIQAGTKLGLLDAHYKYSALGAALSPEQVSRPLRLEMAELLLSNGANPNLPEGKRGATLLEELTRTIGCPSDEKSYRYVWEPRAKAMELLIRHGAKVNLANLENGNTPLHYAAVSGNPDLVQLMLEHGAEVNVVNRGGYTPLYYLASSGSGCREGMKIEKTVEMLVAHGADMKREVNGKKLADLVDRRYPGGDTLNKIIVRLADEQRKTVRTDQIH